MVEHGKHCLGCTACASVCPKSAIVMQADSEGYLYPSINDALCIDCGLCDGVCPLNGKSQNNFQSKVYAVQHKRDEVLRSSTSGGMFTALSDAVLTKGGVVYGAAFDESFKIVHIRAVTEEQRDRCRGSKYAQSDLLDTFKRVKQDLEQGLLVLFTGTPCQVDGLRHFLKKDYANLYLCDLICHGTSSPLVCKAHVKMLEKRNRSRMVEYQFARRIGDGKCTTNWPFLKTESAIIPTHMRL